MEPTTDSRPKRSRQGQTELRAEVESAKSKVNEAVDQAKEVGKEQLTVQKDRAADQVQQLAGAIERAGAALEQEEQPSLAGYTRQIATTLNQFSESLRNRNISDLITDTRELARQNPALFVLGSIGVGIALARFLKASSDRAYAQQYAYTGSDTYTDESDYAPAGMQTAGTGSLNATGSEGYTSGPTAGFGSTSSGYTGNLDAQGRDYRDADLTNRPEGV